MALRIRLARGGAKKRPFYKLVVAENTSPRDGKFLERLGSYNPLLPSHEDGRFVANAERVKYWLSVGAQVSKKVEKLLSELQIIDKPTIVDTPVKSAPKKKAQEKMKVAAAIKTADSPPLEIQSEAAAST
ncbi:MAG: 30S ribosomal protein S16 [Holosporales bacterium]|jgi:small subunit ribosomal protein S16|nr:30S ribosomal protein S16 [Holosporales bacterium]